MISSNLLSEHIKINLQKQNRDRLGINKLKKFCDLLFFII
jgi:hypothetical protein